jgi:hypothetical protein
MRSTIFAAVLAAGGLVAAGGKADAQIFYPYAVPSYNYNYGVNPYTGAAYSTYNYGVPGLYGYNTATYATPYGGYSRVYTSGSPYTGGYYQSNYYNPYTRRGGYSNYTVYPNGNYYYNYPRW